MGILETCMAFSEVNCVSYEASSALTVFQRLVTWLEKSRPWADHEEQSALASAFSSIKFLSSLHLTLLKQFPDLPHFC